MSAYLNRKPLEEKAQKLVDLVCRKGGDTAVVELYQKSEFDAEIRRGEVENLSEAESFGAYVSVSKDQRRASVSSCDLSDDSLNELAERAVALCRYTDVDAFYTLPDADLLATEKHNYDLFDERLLTMSAPEKMAQLSELERIFLAQDDRIKPDGASVATAVAASALANSLGFCMSETTAMIARSVSGFAEDEVQAGDLNTGRKQTGYFSTKARHLEDLQDDAFVAQEAAKSVLRKLGAQKPRTGKFPVYFEPRMARTLWDHFIKAIGGSAIFRRESFLIDRVGSKVCTPLIQICDDPTIPRGLRSRNYDDEGVACKPLDLVKDGELQTYIMSTYSANKLGGKPTGHSGGISNFRVSGADPVPESALLREMDTGVWVISLLGSGANTSTGDYSRGALGLWVEGGEVQYPIREFTLAGHMDRMFQGIVRVTDTLNTGSHIQTPGLLIDEMTISGS